MYKIKFTEKNNQKANDYETRSLLYLLSMRDDSDDISFFFVDCLNDLTGADKEFNKLWDTQAKGVSSLNPTKIGKSLITLFDNYISDLDFIKSILILPKISDGYLVDNNIDVYYFDNFIEEKKSYLKKGLLAEYKRRENITKISDSINAKVEDFLNEVVFAVGLEKDEYIKDVIHFKNKDEYSYAFYENIFNEIRDKQSALKNICLEGMEIENVSELLEYKKFLKSSDIKLMVLNRFVGNDIFKLNSIPISYLDEVKDYDSEDLKDLLQDNNSNLSKAFFNKNNKESFWLLLENIIQILNKNKKQNIRSVFDKVNKNYLRANYSLDENSLLFFIALIKDGINDN